MPVMEPGHEVDPPATDDPTPLPLRVEPLGDAMSSGPPPTPPDPTPASVLLAVAATDGSWFPSRYAVEARIARESLDDPLAELRVAGLVRIAEWVRGVGQGYALTPEGKAAASDPVALERLKQHAPPPTPPTAAPDSAGADDATEGLIADKTRNTELILNPPL